MDLPVGLQDLYISAGANSPMLHRDESMIQRAEVAVNLARKEYYPDFTLNGGYYNMGGMPPCTCFEPTSRFRSTTFENSAPP